MPRDRTVDVLADDTQIVIPVQIRGKVVVYKCFKSDKRDSFGILVQLILYTGDVYRVTANHFSVSLDLSEME